MASDRTNTTRQRRYVQQMRAKGLVLTRLWVPAESVPEWHVMAEIARLKAELSRMKGASDGSQ